MVLLSSLLSKLAYYILFFCTRHPSLPNRVSPLLHLNHRDAMTHPLNQRLRPDDTVFVTHRDVVAGVCGGCGKGRTFIPDDDRAFRLPRQLCAANHGENCLTTITRKAYAFLPDFSTLHGGY